MSITTFAFVQAHAVRAARVARCLLHALLMTGSLLLAAAPITMAQTPPASAAPPPAPPPARPPAPVIYFNTSLLACPEGQQLGYFFLLRDLPHLRGSSWCDPVHVSTVWANATDPLTWRLPYRVEHCTPGVGWTYSHATAEGGRFMSWPQRDIHMLCLPNPTPPLGCALGAGGFSSCPAAVPQVDAALPSGTPLGGGPSADAGAPGGDELEVDETLAGGVGPAGSSAGAGSGSGMCRAEPPAAEAVGNPVFAGNGNKYQREPDLDGPPGLALVRHYNSSLPGWVHNHGMQVIAQGDRAQVSRPDGRVLRFTRGVDGAWSPGPGVGGRLVQVEGGWRFLGDDDTQEDFDAQGRLLRVTPRGGPSVWALRGADGRLQAMTDDAGRSLRFRHDPAGRIVQAEAPDGAAVAYGYDAAGRLAQVSFADGASRQYLYEDTAFPLALTGLIDERGQRVATWRYDAQGRAVSSERPGLAPARIEPLGEGQVSITQASGLVTRQSYQRQGQRLRLVGQAGPCIGCRGNVARRTLDAASGLAVEEEDFLGIRHLTTWDPARRLPLARVQAAGRAEAELRQVEWHPQWRLPLRITDADRRADFFYDEAGRLVQQVLTDLASGRSRRWEWGYDTQGRLASQVDPRGGRWSFARDAWGQLVMRTDPLGQVTRFSRDAVGRVLSRIDPDGVETRFTYHPRGWLTQTDRGGERTAFSYTPTGRLASVVTPEGESTWFDYDAADQWVAIRDSRGNTRSVTRDSAGAVTAETVTDAQGQQALVRRQRNDAYGQVEAWWGAADVGETLRRDVNGRVVGHVNSLGGLTQWERDAQGRVVRLVWPDQAQALLAWGQRGQLAAATDPLGVSTRYAANGLGELVGEDSPDIGRLRWQFDAGGQLVAMEDALGRRSTVDRDLLGRPVRLQLADGQQVRLAYDPMGRLLVLEDASGSSSWTRDALGRVTQRAVQVNDHPTRPRRFTLRYTWGPGGLAAITYPSGLEVVYRREGRRIIGIDVRTPASGNPGVSLRPWLTDLAHTALGQPQAWRWVSSESGESRDRGSRGDDSYGGNRSDGDFGEHRRFDIAQRHFDADGRVLATEFARYSYDVAGRLATIEQDLFSWPGRRRSDDDSNGHHEGHHNHPHEGRNEGDRDGQYEGHHRGRQRGHDFGHHSRQSAAPTRFTHRLLATYDARHRLIALQGTDQEYRYRYDANGNRLSFVRELRGQGLSAMTAAVSPAVVARAYRLVPGSNQVQGVNQTLARRPPKASAPSAPSAAGGWTQTTRITFPIRPDGRPASDGLRQLEYDTWGRLSRVRMPHDGRQLEVRYLHNALGQRVFKSEAEPSGRSDEGSTGTAFIHGEPEGPVPAWALLGEYDGGSVRGEGDAEYIWLPTEDGGAIAVGMWRRERLLAIHTDGLGSPRQVTDPEGRLLWQWPYSGFGELGPMEAQIRLPLRFPGQYADAETGWVHHPWRTYLPSQGRFLQPDPLGLVGGWNRYLYAEGDPLSRDDPWGLDATRWWPGARRSFFDGPRNGNWGGKHWSGGVGGGTIGPALPTDSADACYMRHDLCYDAGGDKSRCDAQLVKELRDLPEDVQLWSQPPRSGTEADTLRFRSGALLWFR